MQEFGKLSTRKMGRLALSALIWLVTVATVSMGILPMPTARAESSLQVAFGSADITPSIDEEKPVWLAGYGNGRKATGVHDPLLARCVVLKHQDQQIALVSVDLVGLQYPVVKKIRERLPDFDYVMVSSTHNHEGPDVIGIWGKTPLQRGVDDAYIKTVQDRIVAMVKDASGRLVEVTAKFGTAEDESLVNDSRKPIAKDAVIRTIAFQRLDDQAMTGVLVQWNSHPEAMGSKNTLITADFPAATVERLKKRYRCPIAYFSGAVGGLMAPPRGVIKADDGSDLKAGDFEYTKRYGEAVADLAVIAVEAAEPIRLTPLVVQSGQFAMPIHNPLYRAAQLAGVLSREGFRWTGRPDRIGEPIKLLGVGQVLAVQSEVAYLRMGELGIACIPGELYPELVYGRFQDPADPNVDYPNAPLEPTVAETIPEKKWLLIGLANDELGYIIPRRQWDNDPPFAYGRKSSQYGEVNSCSTLAAPIIMKTLQKLVAAEKAPSTTTK